MPSNTTVAPKFSEFVDQDWFVDLKRQFDKPKFRRGHRMIVNMKTYQVRPHHCIEIWVKASRRYLPVAFKNKAWKWPGADGEKFRDALLEHLQKGIAQ